MSVDNNTTPPCEDRPIIIYGFTRERAEARWREIQDKINRENTRTDDLHELHGK